MTVGRGILGGSSMIEGKNTITKERIWMTIRSLGSTCSSSPSDLMTRLSLRDRRMPSMSNSFRDLFSFRFSVSSHVTHCTVRKCLMSKKNKGANFDQSCHSARSCFQETFDECVIAIREEPNLHVEHQRETNRNWKSEARPAGLGEWCFEDGSMRDDA